jgi:hypothetical protein
MASGGPFYSLHGRHFEALLLLEVQDRLHLEGEASPSRGGLSFKGKPVLDLE